MSSMLAVLRGTTVRPDVLPPAPILAGVGLVVVVVVLLVVVGVIVGIRALLRRSG